MHSAFTQLVLCSQLEVELLGAQQDARMANSELSDSKSVAERFSCRLTETSSEAAMSRSQLLDSRDESGALQMQLSNSQNELARIKSELETSQEATEHAQFVLSAVETGAKKDSEQLAKQVSKLQLETELAAQQLASARSELSSSELVRDDLRDTIRVAEESFATNRQNFQVQMAKAR